MSAAPRLSFDRLQQAVRDAVRTGEEIRHSVATRVAETLQHAELDEAGLLKLAEAVLQGAREGYEEASGPDQRDRKLREVIDGLADGVSASAQAVRLTLEEAAARGQAFAEKDLRQAAANLRAAGGLFGAALRDAARQISREVTQQLERVQQHAAQAWARIERSVQDAARTVAEHPAACAKQALRAGWDVATHAAGTLVAEMGRRLERLGNRVRSKP